MWRTRHPSAGDLEASPPGVHCGMLPQTLSSGATGEGRPPRRRREAAAAISPRQGPTPTSTHRHMTGQYETDGDTLGHLSKTIAVRIDIATKPNTSIDENL